MALSERLALLIDLDAKGAIHGLTSIGKTAETELGKVEGKAAKLGKTMTHVGIGMIGVGAVIGGALFKAAEAFDHAELSEIKLDNSIKNSKKVAASAKEEFVKLAHALQLKTVANHVDIIAGEAQLVQMGATTAQVKILTPLIVDLARKKGIDLVAASQAVGKALNGTSGALARQGVIIDKTAFAADHFTAINDALRRSVAGFAEKEGKTFAGSLAILKNQLKDVEEGIGKGAVDAFSKLLGPVTKLSTAFTNLSPGTQSAIGEFLTFSAVGLVAVGTLGTLAGKVISTKASFAALAEEMPLVAAGLSAVAGAAGVIGLLAVGGAISKAIDPGPHANIDKLGASLLDFKNKGKVTGEAARFLGADFGHLNHAIEHLVAPSNITAFGKALGKPFGGIGFNTNTHKAAAEIDGLDKSLAALSQRDPKAATATLDAIHARIGDKNFDRLKPLLDDYNKGLEATTLDAKVAADAQGTLGTQTSSAADDFVKLRGIVGKNIDPIKELTSAIDGLVSQLLGLEVPQDAFQHDLNDLPQAAKDAAAAHLNLRNALVDTSNAGIDLRAKFVGIVSDGAKVIDKLVEMHGTTADVAYEVGVLSRQFEADAKAAGLPQPVIDHYLTILAALGQVNITPTVTLKDNVGDALAAIQARLTAFGIKGGPGAYYLPIGTQGPVLPLPQGPVAPVLGPPVPKAAAKRASGGRVVGRQPYLIGEEGPEIMVPDSSGYVVSNQRLRGAGGTGPALGGTNVYHFHNHGVIGSRADTDRWVQDSLARAGRRGA